MPGAVATHSDAVHVIYLDTCEFEQEDWADIATELQFCFTDRWKSLRIVDNKWSGREIRVILENDLASIGIAEYCGITAISIYPDVASDDTPEEFGEHWCNQVSDKMQAIADSIWPGLTLNRTSAWTSEVRKIA